jgi:molybdate transport repressor ModE-like protein
MSSLGQPEHFRQQTPPSFSPKPWRICGHIPIFVWELADERSIVCAHDVLGRSKRILVKVTRRSWIGFIMHMSKLAAISAAAISAAAIRPVLLLGICHDVHMSRIMIKPSWILSTEAGDHFEPQLFRLLRAIHENGKLTLAVKAIGLSYRHAWDLLGKWSRIFGSDLVAMERGRGAKLTALGEKLLWAERRTEASLFPQLENIASDLNVEIRKARQRATSVIRLHASHGYAVERLPELMRNHGNAEVDLKYIGSVEALASLHRSTCDVAGFHVPVGDLGATLWEQYAKWVKPQQQRVIRMVLRTQGLIVAKRNPLGIKSLRDLVRPEVKFVNRQPGSGTRVLLDGLLRSLAIDPSRINGYDSGEFTHAAIAAFVASGMADVGLGVAPAARQFKLDFVPIAQERYMLTCKTSALTQPAIAELISLLKGPEFADVIDPIDGYALDDPGEVVAFDSVLPWVASSRRKS